MSIAISRRILLGAVISVLVVVLFLPDQARAQSTGPTVAPDLVSVGNFRPGPVDNNGDFRTFVDFTFDQPAYLTGSNRTSFALVPVGGGDSLFGSDFIPSMQTDPEGDNTITVLFNGSLDPSDFARGFVASFTVSSGPQGNEPANINQSAPIAPGTTSVNPDLVSVRLDCQQNQAFFTFDEPLDQEDVVQNTGGLRLYFSDTTNAGAQAVRQTGDPAVLRAVFSDLPQGKTLSDAVGGYVTNGSVAGQPPDGPGGQAINQFDEIAPAELGAGCGTDGGTDGGTGGGGAGGDTDGMQPGEGGTGGTGGGGTGDGGAGGGTDGGTGGMQPGEGGAGGSNGGSGGDAGGTGSGGDQNNVVVSDNVVVTQTQTAELTQECQTTATVEQTGTARGGNQYSDTGSSNQTVQANLGGVTVNATGASCQQTVDQVQAGGDAAGSVESVDPSLASSIVSGPTALSTVR